MHLMAAPIVFADIDNTLAARDLFATDERKRFAQCAPPTPAVADALRRAAEHGTTLMLCTGRPRCGIAPEFLELPISGMVCCSGAWAEVGGKVVLDERLPQDLVAELVDRVAAARAGALFESNEAVCILETRPEMEHDIPTARDLEGLRALNPELAFSKMIVDDALAAVLKGDAELLRRVTVFDAAGSAHEVTLPSINKAAGIVAILDELGRESHGTIYGIGDSENDAALFEAVDVAIAMGNAPDSLKERADWVAPDVFHDGAVDALAHFGLI